MAARFASSRCERAAALVMRTIRRQVYALDRRLALLKLRQGKCRCAATVRTSAGCPDQWVRFANSAHFSACRRKNFTEAIFRTLRIPGYRIAPFLILRCNENCMVSPTRFRPAGRRFGSPQSASVPSPCDCHEAVRLPAFFALIFGCRVTRPTSRIFHAAED